MDSRLATLKWRRGMTKPDFLDGSAHIISFIYMQVDGRYQALPLPPRIDRPDIDQCVAADEVVEVVQVDRRVAMRRHQLDAFAQRGEGMGPRREEQASVLVAGVRVGCPGRAPCHDL